MGVAYVCMYVCVWIDDDDTYVPRSCSSSTTGHPNTPNQPRKQITKKQIADDYPVPEIADEAKYITVTNPTTEAIYCRLVVPNPTYMA